MADAAGVTPPAHSPESAVIDAVLDLLVDAMWADVMDVSRNDGLVPEGTEPLGASNPGFADVGASNPGFDNVAGVPSPPEAA